MFQLRDLSEQLYQALERLGQPFVAPSGTVVQAGNEFAESAHNLVSQIASHVWCDIEMAVADELQEWDHHGIPVTVATPPPPENVLAKVDLAIAAFGECSLDGDAVLLNRPARIVAGNTL